MMIATFGSGRDGGAFGLFGGSASPPSKILLCYPDGREIDVPALANIERVPPGTVLKKWNTGGGGYGLPRRRAFEKIERDLCEGYVSAEEARHTYGYGLPRQT
jgi:N-methylhydantoinase B